MFLFLKTTKIDPVVGFTAKSSSAKQKQKNDQNPLTCLLHKVLLLSLSI